MSDKTFTPTVPPRLHAALSDIVDPILGRPDAAAILGISTATFDRICRRGEGPRRLQVSTRRIGFRLSELRRWATAQQYS